MEDFMKRCQVKLQPTYHEINLENNEANTKILDKSIEPLNLSGGSAFGCIFFDDVIKKVL